MKKKTIHKNKLRRDCWNLDMAFFIWLKERLPVYLKDAGKMINLEYHIIEIDGQEFTQREIIEMMIKDLDCITELDDWDKEYELIVDHLMKCWSKVILAMWW